VVLGGTLMSNYPVTDSAATGRDGGPRAAPGAMLEVRYVDAAGGVVVTVCGVIGRNDAAVLSKHLHTALDAAPTVVVNLRRVQGYDPAGSEVLAQARERARAGGTGPARRRGIRGRGARPDRGTWRARVGSGNARRAPGDVSPMRGDHSVPAPGGSPR
jgi:anti-anti-sigma regulatory factor